MKYCSLHQHSDYSFLDSCNKIESLVARAKELGMKALAITDHGHVHGIVKFYNECKKQGIKPILGCEAYFTHNHKEKDRKSRHITLLCENNQGLKNLYNMLTVANTPVDEGGGFFYRPRISWDELSKYREGIICLTGCMNSPMNHEFGRNQDYQKGKEVCSDLKKIFGSDNLFVEMQLVNDPLGQPNRAIYIPEQDIIFEWGRKVASELGLKTLASNDSHYLYKDDAFAHEILKCIDAKATLKTPIVDHNKGITRGRLVFNGFDYHVKSTEDMLEKFTEEEIATTDKVANMCNVELEHDLKMPLFEPDITPDEAYNKLLEELRKGWISRKIGSLPNKKDYEERIKTELKDIKDANLFNYFLIVWDVLRYCRENLIPVGPGRGSAAGSLVSYLLYITQVDPLKYGLLWERFWNRGRSGSMPDIDVDVSIRYKDDVVEYIKKKFGEDRVFPMMTIGKMESKAALKDVGRAMGLPHSYMNEITKHIPVIHGKNMSIQDSMKEVDILKRASEGKDADIDKWKQELAKLDKKNNNAVLDYKKRIADREKALKKTFEVAQKLEGCARNRSVHACALLISDRPVKDSVPLIWDAKKKQYVTGFDMYDLEDLGFLKLDILGLKTLDVIADAHPEGAKCLYEPEKYFGPWDDPAVYSLFAKGRTKGIFQLETPLGRTWCKKMKPKTQGELSDLVALIRPAVLDCLGKNTKILINEFKWGKNKRKGKGGSFVYKTIEELYRSFKENPQKGYKHIKQILSLDESNNSFVRNDIVDIVKTGIKKVYSIKLMSKLEGGNSKYCLTKQSKTQNIQATANHRFLTNSGWKRLKDIKPGEYICVSNKRYGCRRGNNSNSDKPCGYKNYRNLAFYNYEYRCIFCDENKGLGFLDVNHIDGNRHTNNNPDNLCFMCPNHHREFSMGLISQQECIDAKEKYRLSFNNSIMFLKVESVEFVGEEETYDIAMKAPHHNFVAGDFIVHNSGLADEYLKNKKNPDDVMILHKDLETIFQETKNIMLFQEQMIQVAKTCAGFSLEEADKLRKACGKKLPEEMAKYEQNFMSGCLSNGYDEKLAKEIWDWINASASYSFNKSHSMAYGGFLGYITAYMKVYYPAKFILSLLKFSKNEQDSHNEIMELFYDSKLFGITVKPPSTKKLNIDFELDGSDIYFGLSHIKHVGQSTIKNLKNLGNIPWFCVLLDRTNNHLKRDVFLSLILSGAFDHYSITRKCMRQQFDFVESMTTKQVDIFRKFLLGGKIEKETKKSGKMTFEVSNKQTDILQAITDFRNFLQNDNEKMKVISKNAASKLISNCNTFISQYDHNSDFGPVEKAGFETYYLGVPLTCSEVDLYEGDARKTHHLVEVEREFDGVGCCVIAIINKITQTKDKKNREMAFIGLQDRTYQMDAVVFSHIWERYRDNIELGKIFLIEGKKSRGGFQVISMEEL